MAFHRLTAALQAACRTTTARRGASARPVARLVSTAAASLSSNTHAPSPPAALQASRSVTVGVVQAHADVGGPRAIAANAARIEPLVRRAAEGGAQIILLPEAYLQGYSYRTMEDVWPYLDKIELDDVPVASRAPASSALCAMSRRFGVYIGTSLYERTVGGDCLNTFVLAQPDGSLHPVRLPKQHPANFERFANKPFYRRDLGEGGFTIPPSTHTPRVIDTPLARLGVSICYDCYHADTHAALSHDAPDLILMPHSAMIPAASWAMPQRNVDAFTRVLREGAPAFAQAFKRPVIFANKTGPWTTSLPLWYRYVENALVGPGTYFPGESGILEGASGTWLQKLGDAPSFAVSRVTLPTPSPILPSGQRAPLLNDGELAALSKRLQFPANFSIPFAVNHVVADIWYALHRQYIR